MQINDGVQLVFSIDYVLKMHWKWLCNKCGNPSQWRF